LAAVALAFIGWRWKSLIEERVMVEQFGPAYVDYRHRVKALIPFVL
jgi:protein-S-isoprenylcysteine O-methyltransferase Ste14